MVYYANTILLGGGHVNRYAEGPRLPADFRSSSGIGWKPTVPLAPTRGAVVAGAASLAEDRQLADQTERIA
jgi:hypothetical protein